MASFLNDIEKALIPLTKLSINTLASLYGVYAEAYKTIPGLEMGWTHGSTLTYLDPITGLPVDQTEGNLVVGREYTITIFVNGDDFTSVGGANVTGDVFVATGAVPRMPNLYDRVQLTYTYETVPYFKGHLLVTGLTQLRASVDYYWQMEEIFLWVPRDTTSRQPDPSTSFRVDPNDKLNIISRDFQVAFRVTDKPVMTGYGNILCYKYQLVPFNETEFNMAFREIKKDSGFFTIKGI